MVVGNAYTIRLSHWLIAIVIALFFHAFFMIQLKHDTAAIGTMENSQSITISLKKLASPVIEIQPKLQEIIQPEPPQTVKQPEEPKPEKRIKIEKPTPQVKKPEVQPLQAEVAIKERPENLRPSSSGYENTKPVTNSQLTTVSGEKKVTDSSQIHRDYLVKLSVWLAKHKRYPSIARRKKHEDTVKVRFVIDANGVLMRYEILKASKFASLNKAVVSLLKDASPMPAVPAAIQGGKSEFEYTIPIEYKLVD